MFMVICEVFLCTLDVIVINLFSSLFLKKKRAVNFFYSILSCFALIITLSILSIYEIDFPLSGILNILFIFLFTGYQYEYTIYNSVGIFLIYIIIGITTVLFLNIFLIVTSIGFSHIYTNLLSRAILGTFSRSTIIITLIYIKLKRLNVTFNKRFTLNLLSLLFSNLIIISIVYAISLFTEFKYINGILTFGTILMLINLYITVISQLRISKLLIEKSNLVMENQMLILREFNKKILEQKINELNKVKHDFKHFFNLLDQLIKDNKYDQISSFVETQRSITSDIVSNVSSGNTIIDGVINFYIEKYPKIQCNREILISNTIGVNEIELCAILSNILSNAFEASTLVSQPYVNIRIRSYYTNLSIRIENSYINKSKQVNQNSTKFKSNEHGFGFDLLSELVNKYDGIIKQSSTKDCYIISILLKSKAALNFNEVSHL